MVSDRKLFLALGCIAMSLAGCASNGQLGIARQDNFGEAYRQTLAAQVINPAPEYDTPFAASDGDVIAQAIERYRTGKVIKPDRLIISELGKQGGDSGSSGDGGN